MAGEEISVDVEFRNPLAVQLKLSEVRLIAEFKASGEGARPSDPDGEHPLAPGPQQVQIAASSFTLGPQVTQVEQLVVRPHVAGWLRLVGVQWRVNEGVEGRVYFDIKGRRRKNPKGGRWGAGNLLLCCGRRLLGCSCPAGFGARYSGHCCVAGIRLCGRHQAVWLERQCLITDPIQCPICLQARAAEALPALQAPAVLCYPGHAAPGDHQRSAAPAAVPGRAVPHLRQPHQPGLAAAGQPAAGHERRGRGVRSQQQLAQQGRRGALARWAPGAWA